MGSIKARKMHALLPKLQSEDMYYNWTGDLALVLLGHGLEQYSQPKTESLPVRKSVDQVDDKQLSAVLLLSMAQHLKDEILPSAGSTHTV